MAERDPREEAIQPYLAHLRALPFIRDVQLKDARSINHVESRAISLETTTGKNREAHLRWSKSHLTKPLVDMYIQNFDLKEEKAAKRGDLFFVFAPAVGADVARRFDEANINYVDLAGNCRVQIGDSFIAQVEGKRIPVKAPRQRALRAPSLQVLFTLLAAPELLNDPVRTIAEAAGGVSPQTVSDLRKRFVAEEWAESRGRQFRWTPDGKERALDFLLANYDQLSAHLQLGRFRLRPGGQEELEQEIALALRNDLWAFGGGAALERMAGTPELEALSEFYRGTRTIIYLEGEVPSLPKLLVPDERGDVIFSRFPGQRARSEHFYLSPVLIYLDLMTEGEPRAVEAAQELRDLLFREEM